MKIYILPVAKEFQPNKQNYRMPTHGLDMGVEQDFYEWLLNHPHVCTTQSEKTDWEYLPIFWNRLYINWDWGQGGLDKIQNEILRLVSRNRPTFTICEYDIASMQQFYDLCGMTVFIASRRGDAPEGIDIPLLCSRHQRSERLPEKKFIACFAGNLQTDGLRMDMQKLRGKVQIISGNKGTEFFVNQILSSYIALAPRGHGGQSYRFYEAMDLGVVPYHIGIPDTRPFKQWIDWNTCSFYAPTVQDIRLDWDKDKLLEMGRKAQRVYHEQLQYGKWCRYVLKELEQLKEEGNGD